MHASLKYSRNVSAADNDRGKCPLNGICTPEKSRCQSAPVFPGGNEDGSGTCVKWGTARLPPSCYRWRWRYFSFWNRPSNFPGVPHSAPEQWLVSTRLHPGGPGVADNSNLQENTGCRGTKPRCESTVIPCGAECGLGIFWGLLVTHGTCSGSQLPLGGLILSVIA